MFGSLSISVCRIATLLMHHYFYGNFSRESISQAATEKNVALAVSLAGFLRLDNHSLSKLQPQEHSIMANVRQTTQN